MLELMPISDNTKNIPLYVQLYEHIKQWIQNEIIKSGIKLPSKIPLLQLTSYIKSFNHYNFLIIKKRPIIGHYRSLFCIFTYIIITLLNPSNFHIFYILFTLYIYFEVIFYFY
jgi:hypothetical protein